MASKNKSKIKKNVKHKNLQIKVSKLKSISSRSSSACSSMNSCSSLTIIENLNETNFYESTSQSNLSEISSSGFSSASSNLKELLNESRSCSPISTSSSNSFIYSFKTKDSLKLEKENIKNFKISNVDESLSKKIPSKIKYFFNWIILIHNFLFKRWDYITILTISFLINLNTLDAGFVYDDNRAIKTNPDVIWENSIGNLFKNDFWGIPLNRSNSHKSYRPLCVLTYKINHFFHQFNARGYHLVNLILHCFVCLLYTVLIKRWTFEEKSFSKIEENRYKSEINDDFFFNFSIKELFKKLFNLIKEINLIKFSISNRLPPLYFLSSIIFTLHPIHTEAVAGLVGRADIGCALFFLLSIYSYDNYLKILYSNNVKINKTIDLIIKKIGIKNLETSKYISLIYLYSCLICATIAMLFKEYGITVLLVCAFYHLITHCKNFHYIQTSKRTGKFNFTKSTFIKLTNTNKTVNRKTVLLFKTKLNSFLQCLHAISFNETFKKVRIGWFYLSLTLIVSIILRILIMGELKSPQFSQADNPTADNKCALTRTLTFFYLIFFNFWLLIYPNTLSFDWSMESIPLIYTIFDKRNIFTFFFFTFLFLIILKMVNYYLKKIVFHLNKNFKIQNETINDEKFNNEKFNNEKFNDEKFNEKVNYEKFIFKSFDNFGYENDTKKYKKFICENYINKIDDFKNICQKRTYLSEISNNQNIKINKTTKCLNYFNTIKLDEKNLIENQLNLKLDLNEVFSLSIILLIIPFLPATNLFFYVGFVIAERCLYIPSMGFCLLVSIAILEFHKKIEKLNLKIFKNKSILIINIIIITLSLCLAFKTYTRNLDWLSEETLYRSGVNVNPPKALGNLASILSLKGLKKEAEENYRKALKYRYNMADVHYNLGILLQEQKRYDEALNSYQAAIHFRPRLAAAYLNMGYLFNLMQRKTEAIEMYKKCSSLNNEGLKDLRSHEQNKISALFNLGKLYSDQGDYKLALKTYKQALNEQSSSTYYQLHSLYNLVGEVYFKLNDEVNAEKYYLKSIETKKDHLSVYLNYAKFLQKNNRIDEAEKIFLLAREISPNDTSVVLHFGQFYCDLKKYKQAINLYKNVLPKLPKTFELMFNFANILRFNKNLKEAEHYYKLAVNIKPNEVSGHLNFGAILHLNGKLDEAKNHYLVALKLRPNDSIAKINLKKLENLIKQKNLEI